MPLSVSHVRWHGWRRRLRLAGENNGPLTDVDAQTLSPILERCTAANDFFYLPQVVTRRNRFGAAIEARATYAEMRYQLRALREELDDALDSREVPSCPPEGPSTSSGDNRYSETK